MDNLLTTKEVAKYLNIKMRTLYAYIQSGYIPHIRINKKTVRFKLSTINEWLKTLENGYKEV